MTSRYWHKARPCGQYPEACVQVWSNTGKSQLLSQLKFYCKTNDICYFYTAHKTPYLPFSSPPPPPSYPQKNITYPLMQICILRVLQFLKRISLKQCRNNIIFEHGKCYLAITVLATALLKTSQNFIVSRQSQSLSSQGCALAAPSGPWLLTYTGEQKILAYFVDIIYWAPGFHRFRALASRQLFFLEHSLAHVTSQQLNQTLQLRF